MPETPDPLTQTRTRLSRAWLVRMVPLTLAMLGLGAWGLVDAIWVYPKRGLRFADHMEVEYLRAIQARGAWGEASVPEPRAALGALEAKADAGTALSELEQARLSWLKALATPGLKALNRSEFTDARARLDELEADLATSSVPKPLSWYDLPSQWVIAAVGFGVGVYLIVFWFRVAGQAYRFAPDSMTLTLPAGQSFGPGDLAEEADWRKWSKFIVFLRIKPEHSTLGGQILRIDLFRHTPLEAWIMAMEKQAFPECEQPGKKPAAPEPEQGEQQDASSADSAGAA